MVETLNYETALCLLSRLIKDEEGNNDQREWATFIQMMYCENIPQESWEKINYKDISTEDAFKSAIKGLQDCDHFKKSRAMAWISAIVQPENETEYYFYNKARKDLKVTEDEINFLKKSLPLMN
jgi:hypothetical protein